MKTQTMRSHDDVPIRYGYSDRAKGRPWIVLILPFGVKVDLAGAFFEFCENDYNIITWEAREILEPADRMTPQVSLSLENHVADLLGVISQSPASEYMIVGYCSGAGVALAAINQTSISVRKLVLVNGEYVLFKTPDCITQQCRDLDRLFSLACKNEQTAELICKKILENNDLKGGRGVPGVNLPYTQPHYFYRYAINYMSYRSHDFEALASSVAQDTLVVTGERDAITNVNSSVRIHEALMNSEIYIDPHGDHYELLRPRSHTIVQISEFLGGDEERMNANYS